jgi:hypothetical protein
LVVRLGLEQLANAATYCVVIVDYDYPSNRARHRSTRVLVLECTPLLA